jgi:hypothetical protein
LYLIIRLALLLFLSAIISFTLAIGFDQLTLTHFAAPASQLGALVLLCAFALIVLAGLGLVGKLMSASFSAYFSSKQRMERKLLFYINKHNRLNRLFRLKKARLLYVSQQKRKQLFKKYDRKSAPS